jgi:hypothetical protein
MLVFLGDFFCNIEIEIEIKQIKPHASIEVFVSFLKKMLVFLGDFFHLSKLSP